MKKNSKVGCKNIPSIKPLVSAISLALSGALFSSTAMAEVYTFTFGPGASGPTDSSDPRANEGLFTLLDSGSFFPLQNTSKPYYYDATWGYGHRTQITGSLTFDTETMSGVGAIAPFEFFGKGPTVTSDMTLANAGIDPNTGHQLVLAQATFNWNGNDIVTELVWDVSGLLSAVESGASEGDVIVGGALPASENIFKGRYPVGPAPVAMTTWNVSSTGGLPLTDDGLSGSPFRGGPFQGFNPNFDITRLVVGDGSGVEFLTVSIESAQGVTPECTGYGGAALSYAVSIIGDNNDPVVNVEWFVDGNMVANGVNADFIVPLGIHTVSATATTDAGRISSDLESVRVIDTTNPVIDTKLVNLRTGEEVTEVTTGRSVKIKMSATDICDANPEVTGTTGFTVENNDRFTAVKKGHRARAEVLLGSPTDYIEFTIVARDAAGNATSEVLSLNVVDKKPPSWKLWFQKLFPNWK